MVGNKTDQINRSRERSKKGARENENVKYQTPTSKIEENLCSFPMKMTPANASSIKETISNSKRFNGVNFPLLSLNTYREEIAYVEQAHIVMQIGKMTIFYMVGLYSVLHCYIWSRNCCIYNVQDAAYNMIKIQRKVCDVHREREWHNAILYS